jgi:hypothetical protein
MFKKFDNIPEIIKYYKKYFPDSAIEKSATRDGHLCLQITGETSFSVEIRECQGSGYYITEIPDKR